MTSTGLRRRLARAAGGALLAAFLAACAHQTGTVVLLPQKDGRPTAVTVRQGDEQVVLDQPYAAARQTTAGVEAYKSSPQEVEAQFGAALAAQPARPASFTLYFKEGTDDLADESRQVLVEVLEAIAKHPVPDVVVVGHTDSVGTDAYNDALALRRAETVRAILVARGLPPASIAVAGRGKREPLVAVPDGTSEPRNRRVEIVVR
jgi:outer membrane protein OmpA-like peptidoglycan-associated protein